MSYRYTGKRRLEYVRDGVTLLRDLIPPALVRDLRRQATVARQIARRIHGPQAHTLQPIYDYDELDRQPFLDFRSLPQLQATVAGILGPDHNRDSVMGVLFEPAAESYCLPWHRDWRDGFAQVDDDEWSRVCQDITLFNQVNAALYTDNCLWIVVGSHVRPDLPNERKYRNLAPTGLPEADLATDEEREILASRYCRSMRGARQISLLAGDVAFYRSCSWHTASYLTYMPRATLHDGFYSAEDVAWKARAIRDSHDDAGGQ